MKSEYKFSGTTFLTIDDKSRLLVPADVRRKLDPDRDSDTFVIKIGANGKPWLWPQRYYDEQVFATSLTEHVNEIEPSADDIDRMIGLSADLHAVAMDRQGRLLLPDIVMELTGTGREVALLGVFNHLQIWNRSDYAQRQREKQRGGHGNGNAAAEGAKNDG